MICEICGKEFNAKGFKIIVEGAELTVCPNCRKFGASTARSRVPSGTGSIGGRPMETGYGRSGEQQAPRRPRVIELVEDYNVIVKNKREELGLSQAQLGTNIKEKESVIRRVETKSMRPTTKVAKKLEKELGVKLLESVDGAEEVEKKVHLNRGLTIGDIIKFKK